MQHRHIIFCTEFLHRCLDGLERLLSKYVKWSTLSKAVPSTVIMFGGGVVADDCARNIEKSVSAITQPCFTSVLVLKITIMQYTSFHILVVVG